MENNLTSKELLDIFRNDKTYENAMNYIIKFIEGYKGKQGYYDYFALTSNKSSVFKMHYHGILRRFIYIETTNDHTLVFHALGRAVIDLPLSSMYKEGDVKEDLYKEIKERAPKDIIDELTSKIYKNLDNYIKDLKIVVYPKWRLCTKRVDVF